MVEGRWIASTGVPASDELPFLRERVRHLRMHLTGLIPLGFGRTWRALPLRDSAGISPDFLAFAVDAGSIGHAASVAETGTVPL